MPPVRITLGADSQAEAVRLAAEVLSQGGVALLPAEGVYGFHALAASAEGVERLRALKPRAPQKFFLGLLARPEELGVWAGPDKVALELARAHWPGALTLVVSASPKTPDTLRAADGTVALRCPGSAFLREVVAMAGGPVVSTSANLEGGPAAVRVEDAPGACDVIVDAGTLSGLPSTVARVVDGTVHVLREGAVSIAGSGP